MSDIVQQPPAPRAEVPGDTDRPTGWRRAHTIALLTVLSLAPGLAAAVDRAWWHALPPGVRTSAYVVSGILILAACSLILARDGSPPETQP
jgi:hypothetical protein